MTAYLISYKGYFEGLSVRTYPDEETAKIVLNDPADKPDMFSIVCASDIDPDLGGPGLVGLYNTITGETVLKFESRAIGKRRVWEALTQTYQNQPHEQGSPAPVGGITEAGETETKDGETDMAKAKKTKTKKAKTTGEPRKPRGVGKAAGKVSDLRLIREGTDRAKVLKLMNGKNTAAQIAQEVGIDEKKVGTICFCLARDCGIGYAFGEKGQLTALYPGDRSYKDVIKKASE